MSEQLSNPRTGTARFPHLSADFFASIVVFLVALPLCIGIAVAVGVSPARALITGIIGGIIVGYFAGSPLQVSGPAAGLFVIIADLLANSKAKFLSGRDLSSLDAAAAEAVQLEAAGYAIAVLGTSVFLAGVLQLIGGKLGLARWFRAVSPAVIKGMLAGIGALILISQLHVMVDNKPMWDGRAAQGGIEHIAALPAAFSKVLAFEEVQYAQAAMTGLLVIAVLVIWPKIVPPRFKLVPASLIAVVVAAVFASAMDFGVLRLVVPANFLSEVTLPNQDTLGLLVDSSVLVAALVIAVVASAETLLCATAVDQMQTGPRTNYDQELVGQGIGNVLCGLLGALPMTGVIVRSSANIQAGARTRLSTILHGAWLLVFVALIPSVLSYIPKAALGAMLVYTGYKLLHIKEARKLWSLNKAEAGIFLATMTVIVAKDLLLGVVVGITLSALKLLYTFTFVNAQLTVSGDKSIARLKLSGSATFVRLPIIAAELEKVPAGAELHVELQDLNYIDHACLDLFANWAQQHEAQGGSLSLDWDTLHAKFRQDEEMPAIKDGRRRQPELASTR